MGLLRLLLTGERDEPVDDTDSADNTSPWYTAHHAEQEADAYYLSTSGKALAEAYRTIKAMADEGSYGEEIVIVKHYPWLANRHVRETLRSRGFRIEAPGYKPRDAYYSIYWGDHTKVYDPTEINWR